MDDTSTETTDKDQATPPPRLFIDKAHPAVYKALGKVPAQVGKAGEEAGLSRSDMELIQVRCSQINGCVACLETHVPAARKAGVSDQKLDLLPAWRESDIYSHEERAYLGIAELVTRMPHPPEQDREYEAAAAVLTPDQMSAAIWTAITINAFNRVSILSAHPVEIRKEQ